jgi:hypothetical protein
MSTVKHRKLKDKSRLKLDWEHDTASEFPEKNAQNLQIEHKPAEPAPAPAPAAPTTFLTFEEYKASGLDIIEQHELIGSIRNDIPKADRDYIDSLLLDKAAKQLEMCIFPMCKMMHVDKDAVWRMLEDQYHKAYPIVKGEEKKAEEVEQVTGVQAILRDAMATVMGGTVGGAQEGKVVPSIEEPVVMPSIEEPTLFNDRSRSRSGTEATPTAEPVQKVHPLESSAEPTVPAHPDEPQKKKVKRQQPSVIQKEVRTYQAKRKRGHRGCCILTLKSKAVAGKWAEMEGGA